jgi:hypothetical protein
VDGAGELLVDADPAWPELTLRFAHGAASTVEDVVTESRATLRLRTGGEIQLEREPGSALFRTPRTLRTEELVHPFLAPAAAVFGYWLGRESFHAAAFVAGGGVWALLGDRGSGKSSTAAWLALAGHEIVCDDMLILDGATALPGPRAVDLRPEPARELGVGEPLGVVGARERWRLRLGPVASGLPLRGWVMLEWGSEVEARPLRGADRLARVAGERGTRLPPTDPAALLDLAALPAWVLRRPHGWSSLGAAGERLLETVAG